MYKTIVPDLITFDTNLKDLPSFVLCEKFDFYSPSSSKADFHYKVALDRTLKIPKNWRSRSEYALVSGSKYYYYRKIAFWNPIFCYDSSTKTISFNSDYLRLPFHLGGIPSVGELISGLVEVELFLKGIITLRGISYVKNNKVIALCSPGFNGKTSHLKKEVTSGCSYIAEDYLIIKAKDLIVYPTCPLTKESAWRRRGIDKKMKNIFNPNNTITSPIKLNKLFFSENIRDLDGVYKTKDLMDYLVLNSMYFMGNIYLKSYIFDKNLGANILSNLKNFSEFFKDANIIKTINYRYEKLDEL